MQEQMLSIEVSLLLSSLDDQNMPTCDRLYIILLYS